MLSSFFSNRGVEFVSPRKASLLHFFDLSISLKAVSPYFLLQELGVQLEPLEAKVDIDAVHLVSVKERDGLEEHLVGLVLELGDREVGTLARLFAAPHDGALRQQVAPRQNVPALLELQVVLDTGAVRRRVSPRQSWKGKSFNVDLFWGIYYRVCTK